jgi:hypothetical protein
MVVLLSVKVILPCTGPPLESSIRFYIQKRQSNDRCLKAIGFTEFPKLIFGLRLPLLHTSRQIAPGTSNDV